MRKPPKIASTYGKEQSFLDVLFTDNKGNREILGNMPGSRKQLPLEQQQMFLGYINDIGIHLTQKKGEEVIQTLRENFNKEQEHGLLNRIDNETSGLLYFAKTPEIYTGRKKRQANKQILKYYITQTRTKPTPQTITTPLAHHKNGKTMLVCTPEFMNSRRKQKMKGNLLEATTNILTTNSDQYSLVCICKGRRHQIRVHLASAGSPILGDTLYNKETELLANNLHLWSIGCVVENIY